MKIVLLGAPGAGKGTHATRLADDYGIPHISTGDIFRANIKNGTELGLKARSYMDQGLLVPDELTVDLVLDRLKQDDCRRGWILDGFPRNLFQAEALTAALAKEGSEIDFAIHLTIADEQIVKRMSGRRVCSVCGASYNTNGLMPRVATVCDRCGGPVVQRADDAPETVLKRLAVYHEQTEPIVGYYRSLGKEAPVDGSLPMDETYAQLTALLGDKNGRHD